MPKLNTLSAPPDAASGKPQTAPLPAPAAERPEDNKGPNIVVVGGGAAGLSW